MCVYEEVAYMCPNVIRPWPNDRGFRASWAQASYWSIKVQVIVSSVINRVIDT